MTPDAFVKLLCRTVRDQASEGVASIITSPPGRDPDRDLVRLSDWYLGLSEDERKLVKQAISLACDHTTFGFLCILDGTRKFFEDPDAKLELRYADPQHSFLLNDQDRVFLHELM